MVSIFPFWEEEKGWDDPGNLDFKFPYKMPDGSEHDWPAPGPIADPLVSEAVSRDVGISTNGLNVLENMRVVYRSGILLAKRWRVHEGFV